MILICSSFMFSCGTAVFLYFAFQTSWFNLRFSSKLEVCKKLKNKIVKEGELRKGSMDVLDLPVECTKPVPFIIIFFNANGFQVIWGQKKGYFYFTVKPLKLCRVHRSSYMLKKKGNAGWLGKSIIAGQCYFPSAQLMPEYFLKPTENMDSAVSYNLPYDG